MTRGFDQEEFLMGASGDSNKRRTPNQNIAIDPALLGIQDNAVIGSQGFGGDHGSSISQSDSHRVRFRLPGALPTSQEDMRIRRHPLFHDHNSSVPQPLDESPPQILSGYPDAGLIDRGGLRDRFLQLYPVPEFQAPPILPEAQSEVDEFARKETKKRVTRSSKKRTSADAGLSAEAEDSSGDVTPELRRSTRRSKRTKTSPTYNDSGDEGEPKRIRKISKLQAKIAAGKAPKKGSLGPNGEVRFREDGQMEFRDVNNPKWTLAAYHNSYRRQFLDEAAEDGEFDLTPDRGEAADDETSYESEQQNWGPSREDWKNITNSEGKRVMFEVEKPISRQPLREPSNWVHDGLILLDGKNHPVKDWPGLNKTLSTEIESWRWEALMRMYPWLTVADLLARMPHTREYRGRILPLQTPQAFTNRAYRFRIPNQIPASNPKHGSETFKEEILKNLSKENAKTTEGLSTLDQFQVDKVKKANQGKFKENSRYVVQDKDSPETRPPSKKRKVHFDDDAESEPKQEESKTKRPRTNDLSPRSIYDDPNEDAYLDSAGFYDGVPDTAGIWDDQEQDGCRIDTAGPQEDQNQEILVPLFASIYDQGLALVVDEDFTSPWAVIQARRNGSQHTKDIHVYWYSQHVPRHVGLDGNEVEDVVDGASWADIMATEPFPGDNQFTWQYDSINDLAAASSQKSLPNTADSSFDVPTHEDHQSLPEQTPNDPQMTPFPSWQTPLSAVNQIGRYQIPSDTFEEVWRDHHGSTGF